MSSSRFARRLSVFLASPSDLKPERETIKSVVAEVNEVVARRLGFYVDVYGWEKEPPAAGRPQGIIDRHIETCDVFLGLLGGRWGEDPGDPTGVASSGFEEEFRLAESREARDGAPAIWLAFRTVPPDQLADPGEQLKRVLSFQTEVRRKCLFVEFNEPSDLSLQVRKWFEDFLFRLREEEAAAAMPPLRTPTVEPDESTTTEPQTAELTRLLKAAAETLAAPEGISSQLPALESLEVSRLELAVRACAWNRFGGAPFDHQAMDVAYTNRCSIRLTAGEAKFVFASLVEDVDDLASGWWWFQKETSDSIVARLFELLRAEIRPVLKRRAIEFLRRVGVPLEEAVLQRLVEASEGKWIVIEAILDYVGDMGGKSLLPQLRTGSLVRNGLSQWSTDKAALRVVAREGTQEELLAALKSLESEMDFPVEVRERLKRVPSADLIPLLDHTLESVRGASLVAISNRREIPADKLDEFAASSIPEVRAAGLEALIDGGRFDSVAALRRRFYDGEGFGIRSIFSRERERDLLNRLYASIPDRDLENEVRVFGPDGSIALELISQRNPELAWALARSGLQDHFKAFRDERDKRWSETLSAGEELSRVLTSWSDEARQREFAGASLRVLAESGDKADVELIRSYVDADAPVDADTVVTFFERFGEARDAGSLEKRVSGLSGADRRAALALSLRLDPTRVRLTAALRSEGTDDVVTALRVIHGLTEVSTSEAETLLVHPSSEVRQVALAVVLRGRSETDIEELLERYRALGRYYYDVSCTLDRILFAPSPLDASFRADVDATLTKP
jgi:hypothetical protein